MKRTPAEEIVGFLGFSPDRRGLRNAIEKFTQREWKHVVQWLDDAGLAFYFLQRVKDEPEGGNVPPSVLSRLERNFASNRLRVAGMAPQFDTINRKFRDAGVRYSVIKGFPLVPQFCPDAALRHQGDFDYLVDGPSLPAACQVLIEAGYLPQDSRSSKESIFVIPGGQPSRGGAQYSPQAPHAVELHREIWNSQMHGVSSIPNPFSAGQSRTKHWNGFTFPAQTDEDAFLLQVLHACHHFFTQWIRTSSLLEIGYFLHRRASDTELWSMVEQRTDDNAVLREFVVIVTEMAARLFVAPVPTWVQGWGARIRLGPRTWIEHYARDWALCELPVYTFSLFPNSKLALFLHHQYKSSSPPRESQHQNQGSSWRLSRMALSIRNEPSLVWKRDWWRHQHLVRRSIFHTLAGLRYVVEIPRWRWLNRVQRRTTSPAPWPNESFQSKEAS